MGEKQVDLYKIIGKNIRHYRKAKGLSQEALADKASISLSYLTKIEAPNCDKSFSLEVLFDISRALDMDARELLEGIK